jgi:hypothetical protein
MRSTFSVPQSPGLWGNARIGSRPEKAAAVNKDFASYEEALQYFLRTVNITDAALHFADIAQGKLPFEDQEPSL